MKKIFILTTLILTTFIFGCSTKKIVNFSTYNPTDIAQNKATYQKLDQNVAKDNLDIDENIILLDVRTPEENQEKRIPNSILLPDYDIDKLGVQTLPDKSSKIYVYCRSGNRSRSAVYKLVKIGYTNVYDIGGINTWQFETESGPK